MITKISVPSKWDQSGTFPRLGIWKPFADKRFRSKQLVAMITKISVPSKWDQYRGCKIKRSVNYKYGNYRMNIFSSKNQNRK